MAIEFLVCSDTVLDVRSRLAQYCSRVVQSAAQCGSTDRGEPVAAKHRVTVNLEDSEYRELSALSEKHRVSLAWLGRQAIIDLLERCENEQLRLPLNLSSERRITER